MLLRPARLEDAASVALLLEELGYPMEPGTVRDRLAAQDCVLVAEGADRVLGLLALHRTVMLQHAAPVARIGALVVADAARRRGIGARLLRRAEEEARRWGCGVLELTSGLQRTGAHAFYEAQGFERASLRFRRVLDRAA